MKVYFSHGKESGPWGSKIKRLAQIAQYCGYAVESIDYRETLDPDQRVQTLIKAIEKEKSGILLVGSSMGGYVSLVAGQSIDVKGIFLLAPALYIEEYNVHEYSATVPIEVVHGWSDDVIPPENSIRFAQENDCTLHLISGDHRLNSSLTEVEKLFKQFLQNHC